MGPGFAQGLFDDAVRRVMLWVGALTLMGALLALSFGLGYRYGLERCHQILVLTTAAEERAL